jgi:hypothetical protein
MAFVFGGLAVVIQTCARATPGGDRLLPRRFGSARRLFAVAGHRRVVGGNRTWVAFGPGERKFSSSIPFLPAWLNEPIGRTVFGTGAILIWIILIVMAVVGARRLRGPKE